MIFRSPNSPHTRSPLRVLITLSTSVNVSSSDVNTTTPTERNRPHNLRAPTNPALETNRSFGAADYSMFSIEKLPSELLLQTLGYVQDGGRRLAKSA